MTDGNAGFRVGSYVDELVTAVPRLQTGLQRLGWSVCSETERKRFIRRRTQAERFLEERDD